MGTARYGRATMRNLPDDIQKLWDDTLAADAAAERLASGLSDEQFFWGPDGGRRWSVALCLDHLAVANAVYGAAIADAIAAAKARGWARRGPMVPGFFGRRFVQSLEPPPKYRSGAPAKIRPRPSRSRAEILTSYREAHDRLRELLVQAAEVDANRATFPNPFFSLARVKVSTGFHVVAAHDRRHLWQAERVVEQISSSL